MRLKRSFRVILDFTDSELDSLWNFNFNRVDNRVFFTGHGRVPALCWPCMGLTLGVSSFFLFFFLQVPPVLLGFRSTPIALRIAFFGSYRLRTILFRSNQFSCHATFLLLLFCFDRSLDRRWTRTHRKPSRKPSNTRMNAVQTSLDVGWNWIKRYRCKILVWKLSGCSFLHGNCL